LKEGLRAVGETAGLPPIEFVTDRESALRGPEAGRHAAQVRNRGLLVALGRIEAEPNWAEVGASLWVDARAMQWLTYVVRDKRDRWRVVGTTGPIAIS
jgi:hypothetical protein